MAEKRPTITFDPQPLQVGSRWRIIATYPSGTKEHITGFKTEAEAVAWLTSIDCYAWLKMRGYAQ